MSTEPTRRALRTTASAEEIRKLQAEHAVAVDERAELAARSVVRLFGKRAFGVPNTLFGAAQAPENRTLSTRFTQWHYWWQAHFLDCAIDASLRAHRHLDSAKATEWFETAQKILRGIHTRNFNVWTNSYYDDMAWLALAAGRLNALSEVLNGRGYMPAQDAGRALFAALAKGNTNDWGGGMFWSTHKNFKNTPATAPAALAFARSNNADSAASLLNWLEGKLWHNERRAYIDGVKKNGEDEVFEEGLFTYNQGPVLSALLEVTEAGGALAFDVIEKIEHILDGIEQNFTAEFEVSHAEHVQILTTHGTGDAGLFTGILMRYLAQVALAETVPAPLRERACNLVVQTAEIMWEGRREFDPDLKLNQAGVNVNEIRGEAVVLFSTDVQRHASETLGAGVPVDLSTQLQGWMMQEAAARVLATTI